MKFTKPSPGLVEEFKAAIEPIRDGQPRKMFGYDCVFVNGNFAAGPWRNTAVFKLSAEDGAHHGGGWRDPVRAHEGPDDEGLVRVAGGRLPRCRAADRVVRSGGRVRAILAAEGAEGAKTGGKAAPPAARSVARSSSKKKLG